MALADFRRGYLLSEAFEAVGRRLYQSTWRGDELQTITVEDPQPAADKASQLKQDKARIDDEVRALEAKIAGELDVAKISSLTQAKNGVRARLAAVAQEIFRTEPQEAHWESYRANLRRDNTCNHLLEALRAGTFRAQASGFEIEPHFWRGKERHFAFNTSLSTVWLPRSFSSKRRALVMLPTKEFEQWLGQILPLAGTGTSEIEPGVLCEAYLRKLAQERPSSRAPKSRRQIYKEAKAQIPRLSEREFRHVWARVVPTSWKKGGRPRG